MRTIQAVTARTRGHDFAISAAGCALGTRLPSHLSAPRGASRGNPALSLTPSPGGGVS